MPWHGASMKTTGLALLLAFLLTGCGVTINAGSRPSPRPSPSPSASPLPLTGPAAYLAAVRTAGLGSKDLTATTDDQLLGLGNAACTVLTDGTGTYGQVAQLTLHDVPTATSAQVDTLIRSAVNNLCPAEKGQLP